MTDTLWEARRAEAKQSRMRCAMQRPHRGHVLCISGRLFGFEGRMDSGAWVMKVAGVSSSLILEDSIHYATLKCGSLDKSHVGIRVHTAKCFLC